jgi:predicted ATPase/DNA-binding winged helix-turn-helix (wHTH) protein
MEPLDQVPRTLALAGCDVDLGALVVRWPDEERRLTVTEAKLLAHLAAQDGRTVDARGLLRDVWGYRGGVISATVKTTIGRLRGKIERDPRSPEHILTVPGAGYRFRAAREGAASVVAAPAPDPASPEERAAGARGNLPPSRDLVGCEGAIEQARATIEGDRWVTLTGPAGVGKSALAAAAVAGVGNLPETPWLVPLDAATSTEDVLAAVASAVGVERAGPGSEPLAAALRARGPTLLLLDDADRVASDVAALAGEWLDGCAALRLVVTCRAPLRGAGETVLPVSPLSPGDAAALFAQRAGPGARPGFADADALGQVLDPLDGLPLAIEMAAGWASFLDPATLASRLRGQVLLLGSEDGAGRHRSIEAAFGSSWELLPDREREALVQATVFCGPFDLEAADAVLRLPDGSALPALRELVRRGLVVRVATTGGGTQTALRLLQAVRELAARRDAGDEVRRRHAEWFAACGDDGPVDRLLAVGGTDAVAGWMRARADIEAAYAWSRERGELPLAARCLRALVVLCRLAGPVGAWDLEARAAAGDERLSADARSAFLLELAHGPLPGGDAREMAPLLDALDALPGEDPRRRATALHLRAQMAVRTGDAAAADAARSAVDAARRLGPAAIGRALVTLANALRNLGHGGEAHDAADEALAHLRRSGDLREEERALEVLGDLALDGGDFEGARGYYRGSLDLSRRRGDRPAAANREARLGSLEALAGEHEAALAWFQRALATVREVGDRAREGYTLANLGAMELDRMRLGPARSALEEALGIGLELADPRLEAAARANLGELLLGVGQHARARSQVDRTIELGRTLHFRRLQLAGLGLRAELAYIDGAIDAARADAVEAVAGLVEVGASLDAGRLLLRLSAREADSGQHEEAARLSARSDALLGRMSVEG